MKQRDNIVVMIMVFLISLIWVYPIIIILLNSFKSYNMIIHEFFALPEHISFDKYIETWVDFKFPILIKNTLIYTVCAVSGIALLAPMSAYKLSRAKTRLSKILFIIILLPIMVPFQAYMISLTRLGSILHFSGTRFGYILTNIGLNLSFAVFLVYGFVKTIPMELEECASIDGASPSRIYWSIILPLLIPIVVTVAVINALNIWNDIIINILIVGGKESLRNLQTALYARFSTQESDWEHALPGLVMSIIPNIVFFFIMQKKIVAGITAGAVKG